MPQLQPIGYADDPRLDRTILQPDRIVRSAESIPGVSAAAPRVNGFAILASGARSYAAAVVGVDPASETRISTIARRSYAVAATSTKPTPTQRYWARCSRAIWASASAGKVTLLGSGRDGSVAVDVLKVDGIYQTGVPDLDRSILEMPFARAQDTFAMDGRAPTRSRSADASLAYVDQALPALEALAEAGVSVRDWARLEPALRDAIDLKYATSMLFYANLVAGRGLHHPQHPADERARAHARVRHAARARHAAGADRRHGLDRAAGAWR